MGGKAAFGPTPPVMISCGVDHHFPEIGRRVLGQGSGGEAEKYVLHDVLGPTSISGHYQRQADQRPPMGRIQVFDRGW